MTEFDKEIKEEQERIELLEKECKARILNATTYFTDNYKERFLEMGFTDLEPKETLEDTVRSLGNQIYGDDNDGLDELWCYDVYEVFGDYIHDDIEDSLEWAEEKYLRDLALELHMEKEGVE